MGRLGALLWVLHGRDVHANRELRDRSEGIPERNVEQLQVVESTLSGHAGSLRAEARAVRAELANEIRAVATGNPR